MKKIVLFLLFISTHLGAMDCPGFDPKNIVVTFENHCQNTLAIVIKGDDTTAPLQINPAESKTTSASSLDFKWNVQLSTIEEERLGILEANLTQSDTEINGNVYFYRAESFLKACGSHRYLDELTKNMTQLKIKIRFSDCKTDNYNYSARLEIDAEYYKQPKTLKDQALAAVALQIWKNRIPLSAVKALPLELQEKIAAIRAEHGIINY